MTSVGALIHQHRDQQYVAVKIYTEHYTQLHGPLRDFPGIIYETIALSYMGRSPPSQYCIKQLRPTIVVCALDDSSRKHSVIITPVYGGDVRALLAARVAPGKAPPLPLAKRILLHLLRGLAHAHERGWVHSDLRLSNIYFTTPLSADEIKETLAREPPSRHPPERSLGGIVRVVRCQPLPMITLDEAMQATFVLGDFGSSTSLRRIWRTLLISTAGSRSFQRAYQPERLRSTVSRS